MSAGDSPWARAARRLLVRTLAARARNLGTADLMGSALVLAPHPDDETLGCGGTIAAKRALGAEVGVVFLTDGRSSHRQHLPGDELARLRAQEARSACAALGVETERVELLGFPDEELREHRGAALDAVVAELERCAPDELFVPAAGDGPPDHEQTRALALEALTRTGRGALIWEYPVWLWHRWPWVPVPPGGRRARLAFARDSLRDAWQLARDFRWVLPLGAEAHEAKLAALARHASQTTALIEGVGWRTLQEVAGGRWLSLLIGGAERFRRYRIPTSEPSPPLG